MLRFNSRLVRLKPMPEMSYTYQEKLSFNSRLVRLKHLRMNLTTSIEATFQFQIGTIKTVPNDSTTYGTEHVSIPDWYD